jgi:hypothetical protein
MEHVYVQNSLFAALHSLLVLMLFCRTRSLFLTELIKNSPITLHAIINYIVEKSNSSKDINGVSLFLHTYSILNKTGKAYSLEYTKFPKAFFTPRHVGRSCTTVDLVHCCSLGHSCTNVIQGHSCAFGHSCTNVSPNHCWATISSDSGLRSFCCDAIWGSTVAQQMVPIMGVVLYHYRPTLGSK